MIEPSTESRSMGGKDGRTRLPGATSRTVLGDTLMTSAQFESFGQFDKVSFGAATRSRSLRSTLALPLLLLVAQQRRWTALPPTLRSTSRLSRLPRRTTLSLSVLCAADSVLPKSPPRLWLWHGTLLGVCYHLRTSGVAFPFVLKRLSNTLARLQALSI